MSESSRLRELSAMALHARRRYSVYKSRVYGSRPSSPARLEVLKRDAERAEMREARAKSNA